MSTVGCVATTGIGPSTVISPSTGTMTWPAGTDGSCPSTTTIRIPAAGRRTSVAVDAVGQLVLDEPGLAQPGEQRRLGGRGRVGGGHVGRTDEHVGELYGQVPAQPVDVVGAELEHPRQVRDVAIVVEQHAIGEPPHAEDIGVRLHQRAHRRRRRDRRRSRRVDDDQHRVARELVGVEALRQLLVELRRLVAIGLELGLLLVVAGLGPVEVALELVELALEAVDGGPSRKVEPSASPMPRARKTAVSETMW